MLIQMTDGKRFSGRNAKAIVRKMRDAAWMMGEPKRDYMSGVADKVSDMTHGKPIETNTAEAFLTSLADAGLAIVLRGEKTLRASAN